MTGRCVLAGRRDNRPLLLQLVCMRHSLVSKVAGRWWRLAWPVRRRSSFSTRLEGSRGCRAGSRVQQSEAVMWHMVRKHAFTRKRGVAGGGQLACHLG